jgi:hypothetical protein
MNQGSINSRTRRGAIGKGCLIGLGVAVAILLLCAMIGVGGYN